MHSYRENPGEATWSVFHYIGSDSEYRIVKTFATEERAARYVNYLNGGNEKITADCYMYEA